MLTKLRMVEGRVLPAPWNTPQATMEAAYMGSARMTIRSTRVARATTAGSGVRMPTITGAAA